MSQKCKDCNGRGWPETGGTHLGIPQVRKCQTCEGKGGILRTGPYRLADGTWSDGVDRSERIADRVETGRKEVWRGPLSRRWIAGMGVDTSDDVFPTHAEAISYADKHARTTTKEETK